MLEAALRDEKEVMKEGNQMPEVAVTEEAQCGSTCLRAAAA